MCTAVLSAKPGQGAQRPLDRPQPVGHADRLDGGGVGVRSARELVEVVADARDLAAVLPPSTAMAGAVQVCVRAIACRSSAESGRPAAAALAFHAARSAGDTRRWTSAERRSAMSAPARGFGGRRPPSARCYGSGAEGGGFEGGRSMPSPEHSVDTLCRLA